MSHHTVLRINDEPGFAWLDSLNSGKNQAVGRFASMDLQYLDYCATGSYAEDLMLLIPDMQPIEWGYAFTSSGERVFCYVVQHQLGHQRQGICFEVPHSVVMLPAAGVKTVGGAVYPIGPTAEVLAPMDGVPIRHESLMPTLLAYFVVAEGAPVASTVASVPPVVSSGTVSPTPGIGGMGFGTSSTAPAMAKTGPAPLYFEIGTPVFPIMTVNLNHHLTNLVESLHSQGGSI